MVVFFFAGDLLGDFEDFDFGYGFTTAIPKHCSATAVPEHCSKHCSERCGTAVS